ncbi:putative uncharacterized protein DDB_G0271982 [Astyanax mexicanus]|uniref:Kinesin-related protein 12-like n=1 Tax=Astyanax mexicanus TaxID=7994 RepID=A0A8T2M414_ASTMX|nr:putative uncharacterized protein DDB_G0271982 [Astyanax mexicanus]KAG9277914.1 kinesin-related protein 12-like [Astyanax mexicanus]
MRNSKTITEEMESEVEVTLELGPFGNFKWTDANTADLIVWRVSNRNLFTGKRNTALRAFEQFVREKELEGKVAPTWVKKKWENLRQKYKDIKSLSSFGGDSSAAPWKWFAIMDQALSEEIPLTPSILTSPSTAPSTPFTSAVLVSSSAQESPPVKRRREQYWLMALQELERRQEERERREAEREEERERRAAEREDERERRAVEREEEREKQALARERRREQEMTEKQERWERELLAREERREKEYREREERRDKEAAAREDRLFKLLEAFVAKKSD